ncbi:hypothetical protein [Mycobacterium palustre]|uniref:hypothetical protein n=1 Tax=Mycobacterium palustre TaxID=153971 RepID=UPI0011509B21|nr:hypothetical protein [Mycobacterium palustre]
MVTPNVSPVTPNVVPTPVPVTPTPAASGINISPAPFQDAATIAHERCTPAWPHMSGLPHSLHLGALRHFRANLAGAVRNLWSILK